ncbi:polysaccharide pyruvyl transferase family protein [Chitinophaga barathri]|uniref:Polysaccharide pyruvyl transferase family protein n=2 Tax=Chitinophaga barathri TaxID=1647451 RepID=A0A3N4MUS5_9BACT|nr:polysaccharide pyruvyl transferase family protein [Chitinophaga barathri]
MAAGSLLIPHILKATGKKDPVLLLVSGWQDVNIGDIAHTPGLIALLKSRMKNARIILWKRTDSEMSDAMLHKHYPDVQIIHGKFDKDYALQSPELELAFKEADFFIHGSGPSVVAAENLRCWNKNTDKGFGIFGVTIQDVPPALKALLEKSSFIFTRETASIAVLKKNGLEGKHIAFAPDATFVLDIHDKTKAGEFMAKNGLLPRKFICAIPRLRYTPYYRINPNRAGWSDEKIKQVDEVNEQYKEIDHAKLRTAMIAWVKKTGNKILVCPEMTYEVDIMKELLIDPLPEEIKPFIVTHDYWLPDEAASVYEKASAVLSFECHSPIIAAANGTPSFYLRQPTDTIKGQMYYDLGFNDWVFEIDDTTGEQITERLLEIHENYQAALKKVKDARKTVDARYDDCLKIMKSFV